MQNSIAQYITGFSTKLDELVDPSPGGNESSAEDELKDLSVSISNQTDPIISALMSMVDKRINTEEPTFDIQNLIDKASAELFDQLDSTDADVTVVRELLRSIVDTALLDSSYQILAADISDVDATVEAFKTEAKSQLDDRMFELERRSVNTMISDGVLDFDIGAELSSRITARKGRQYTEIDNKAEELREQLLQNRWQRLIDEQRTKLQAGQLLKGNMIELPTALYDLLGDLARRRFVNTDTFANALPNILNSAVLGLSNLKESTQRDRLHSVETQLASGKAIIDLWNIISTNLQGVARSASQLATFEAS